MKYTLYSVLVFVVFAGIPAFLQEQRSHIVAETISKACTNRKLEKRAVQGASILRDVREATPDQKLRFASVIASRDGDVCYFMQTWDVRQSPDLAYEDIYINSSRLTEPVLLILLSLVERPRHGCAILRGIPDAPDSNIRSWNSAAATYQCC